jgi:hypothetical protein
MPPHSKSNFFIFPNKYIDTLLFRDEQHINITSISDYQLIFNATDPTFIE